jgi:phosphatidylserine/phosphatidylglycerophosphate/cardiolipin synthase-like enzyme
VDRTNLTVPAQKYGLRLDSNVRYVNTDRLVHCHDKMVVVDGASVLVSSQNSSDFAVTKNREAGLGVPYGYIARHFAAIFDVDRATAYKSPEEMFGEPRITREAFGAGGFIRVERAYWDKV